MPQTKARFPYILHLRWHFRGAVMLLCLLFWFGITISITIISTSLPDTRTWKVVILFAAMTAMGGLVFGSFYWLSRPWLNALKIVFLADRVTKYSWRGKETIISTNHIQSIKLEILDARYRGVRYRVPTIVIKLHNAKPWILDQTTVKQYGQEVNQFYADLKELYKC